jgi:hypothetical protein
MSTVSFSRVVLRLNKISGMSGGDDPNVGDKALSALEWFVIEVMESLEFFPLGKQRAGNSKPTFPDRQFLFPAKRHHS